MTVPDVDPTQPGAGPEPAVSAVFWKPLGPVAWLPQSDPVWLSAAEVAPSL